MVVGGCCFGGVEVGDGVVVGRVGVVCVVDDIGREKVLEKLWLKGFVGRVLVSLHFDSINLARPIVWVMDVGR